MISRTTPLTVDGTSTTALSVSSSITGCPSETRTPGEIISRTRSPDAMFSPNSCNLNSPADDWATEAAFLPDGRALSEGADWPAFAAAVNAATACLDEDFFSIAAGDSTGFEAAS